MLTIEMASLTDNYIEAAVRADTPEGWTFDAHQDEQSRLWVAKFHDGESTQWEIYDITLKQVLLHAVGWLEVRKVKLAEGSRWAPRSAEITQERVHERAYSVTSKEGPQDLEPDEISSVYSGSRRGGR